MKVKVAPTDQCASSSGGGGGGGDNDGGGGDNDGGGDSDGSGGGGSPRPRGTAALETSSDADSGSGESGDEGGAAFGGRGRAARGGVGPGREARSTKRRRTEGHAEGSGQEWLLEEWLPGSEAATAAAAASGAEATESASCASAGAGAALGNAEEVSGVLLQLPRGLGSQLMPGPPGEVDLPRLGRDTRGEVVARQGQEAVVVVVSMREAAEMLQLRPHSVCTKLEGGESGEVLHRE